jgi:hypothetical protein
MKINLDMVNDIIYNYVKFYCKILYIMGYTKITRSDKICRFEIYIHRSRRLSFLCSLKYKKVRHIFFYICGINSWLHAIFFIKNI